MPARVQLIFASSWNPLNAGSPDVAGREISHEIRCGQQICLERGQWEGLPVTWLHWALPHATSQLLVSRERDARGMAVALAAAVESSPDASHWLLLLAHTPSPAASDELEQRMHTLDGSTMVTWRSATNDLLAAGFSCELYSELIRLDSAHAFDRLLRRYPCVQVVEPSMTFLTQEHSPTVNR